MSGGYDASGNSIYADAAGNDTSLGTAAKVSMNKQPIPKINMGFNTNFTYKNFDLGLHFMVHSDTTSTTILRMLISLKELFFEVEIRLKKQQLLLKRQVIKLAFY
jgi:hypothetical protein